MDRGGQALHGFFEGAGSGERAQVLSERFLQPRQFDAAVLKLHERGRLLGQALAHFGQSLLMLLAGRLQHVAGRLAA